MSILTSSVRKDWLFFLVTLTLALGGLFHLYTIAFSHQSYYFSRQIVWVGIGISLLFVFSSFKVSFWEKITYFLYGAVFLSLVLVLFRGEGVHGAQRWLRIGMVTFQPSEFAKLSLILILAKLLANKENIGWKQVSVSFCFTLLVLILVASQPDLGGALIFPPLWLGILFLAGISLRKFLTILGLGASFIPLAYFVLLPYQKVRILAFFNPQRDPLGSGWSALQSKIALGSGRLIGKGMEGTTHTQLSFLPRPFTDFVFASLGEEWGFIGVLLVLGLYFVIIARGMRIARENGTSFAGLVSGGIIVLLFLQVFINVGMVAGIMPITGMPLPLISYGGSSTIMFLSGIGILFSIKRFK